MPFGPAGLFVTSTIMQLCRPSEEMPSCLRSI
jgi:hypothetical protein